MLKTIKKLFTRKQTKYGPEIFYQRTWLSKQVEEAQYQDYRRRIFGLD